MAIVFGSPEANQIAEAEGERKRGDIYHESSEGNCNGQRRHITGR